MSKRTQRSEALEPEPRPLAATHGGRDIDGGDIGLANGMLGRRRNYCAGDGLDRSAVTQRPNLALVILQFQALIDQQFAAFLWAIEALKYWRKRRWNGGDQRLAMDLDARLQYRPFGRGSLQPVSENDFNTAPPQNFLGEDGQRLRHFRQKPVASLNDHAAMRFVTQAKVIPFNTVHEIVQRGHHLNTREDASPDNERKKLPA